MKSLAWLVWPLAAALGAAGLSETASSANAASTKLVGLGINFNTLAPFTPGQFVEIDRQTGVATMLGSPFLVEGSGIGFNLAADSTGQLFNVLGRFGEGRVNRLSSTGEVEQFVPLSDGTAFTPQVYSIAFDSQNRLHGILLNGNPAADALPVLAEIDVTTGLATTLAVVDAAYTGLAFDGQDHLYAAAANVGLVRIDRATGQETVIGGDLAVIGPAIFGHRPIVFDRDGTLLAVTDRLVTVNPSTGAATAVGSATFASDSIVGLAIVPEPSAALLGLAAWLAAAPLVRAGRRGRR